MPVNHQFSTIKNQFISILILKHTARSFIKPEQTLPLNVQLVCHESRCCDREAVGSDWKVGENPYKGMSGKSGEDQTNNGKENLESVRVNILVKS